MYCASRINLVAHTLSPSSISKGISEVVRSMLASSSPSASSAVTGNEPERQALMLAASHFSIFLSSLAAVRHPLQHRGEHRDISTFPVLQSTSCKGTVGSEVGNSSETKGIRLELLLASGTDRESKAYNYKTRKYK